MKNKLIVGGVVVALVLSVLALTNSGKDGRDGRDGQVVGASVGPNRFNPQECIDNVCQSFRSFDFNTASSTFGAVQNPNATSTVAVTIIVTAATTSDYVIALAENTAPYARPQASATSSGSQGAHRRLAEWVVPANTTPAFVFYATSTTQSSDVSDSLVTSPGSYLYVFADDGGLRFPEGVSSTGITGEAKFIYTEFR